MIFPPVNPAYIKVIIRPAKEPRKEKGNISLFLQQWPERIVHKILLVLVWVKLNDIVIYSILRRGGNNTQKNYTKKIFMTQMTTMVRSLT